MGCMFPWQQAQQAKKATHAQPSSPARGHLLARQLPLADQQAIAYLLSRGDVTPAHELQAGGALRAGKGSAASQHARQGWPPPACTPAASLCTSMRRNVSPTCVKVSIMLSQDFSSCCTEEGGEGGRGKREGLHQVIIWP
jgi:hypothetical protein